MAQIDIPLLKAQAVSGAHRVDVVRRDPVVVEAFNRLRVDAQQTLSDARRTLSSGGDFVSEMKRAWVESGEARSAAALDRS